MSLETRCTRALYEMASVAGAGTRQQRRAAARHFVRRHRRDPAYLRWVLRSAGASSALALALLGFGAPADAALPPFSDFTPDPLAGKSVNNQSTPAFGDLDADGDVDLVVGQYDGSLRYFANTGSRTAPAYTERTGAANPFNGLAAGVFSTPSLGDLDGDGDLDALVGRYSGTFEYFENTGNAMNPAFVLRVGLQNPLFGVDVGLRSAPALGDLDGDGDLDLVTGQYNPATFRYFQNTGTPAAPAFVERTGTANPFSAAPITGSTPVLGDVDRDGDLDLAAGQVNGTLWIFENRGTSTGPLFPVIYAPNPLAGRDVGYRSAPALGDLDGDGDLDLVSGMQTGQFLTLKNRRSPKAPRIALFDPLVGQSVGAQRSTPSFGDLDGDGDLDLLAGSYDGTFHYFANTGSALAPAFAPRTGAANPLNGLDVGKFSSPALVDLDADGDLDLVSGDDYSHLRYFANTGTRFSPAFVERTGAANPLAGFLTESSGATPAFGDLDGDGDLDLVVGSFGTGLGFEYFENTGSASSPAFVERYGSANPVAKGWQGYDAAATLGDFDGDGDLDLVGGNAFYANGVFYFENTGSATNPAFVQRTGPASPFHPPVASGYGFLPTRADLDGDGDLDVVFGRGDGTFASFENVGGPDFRQMPPPSNPLSGQNVGSLAAPAVGDVDSDGDGDLVVGNSIGTFSYYKNTSTGTFPIFVAQTGAANPLNGRDVGDNAKPAIVRIDGAGAGADLFAGRLAGGFVFFANTGNVGSPAFAAPVVNPFGLTSVGTSTAPSCGDLDGDGDFDLVAGEHAGDLLYFENTGDPFNPAFVQRFGAANPFDGISVAEDSAPTLGDFDRDGDVDLFVGSLDGSFVYYRNNGNASFASFKLFAGPILNPLQGIDVGDSSAPGAGDINRDGSPDVVAGAADGSMSVYFMPEPGRGMLFGAGALLLSLLARWRRRS
jgi:hypothetical protein